MGRPNLIARSVTLLALVAAIVVVVLVVSGGKTYDLKLQMTNASGLRPGSEVLLGGVQVGTVNALNMNDGNRGDAVIADLHLNPSQVKLGRGVTASIIAANLLGEKYVALSPGDVAQPLPSGSTLPDSATTVPTDLDQIVDVLDGPTRARLAILLDEAGIAVNGRESDVSAILRQFPLSLTAATKLLDTMVQDNHTLADVVANSDQFITRIDQQSGDLKSLINSSAGAVKTFSLRASQLAKVVQGAPQFVFEVHRWFALGTKALFGVAPYLGELANATPRLDTLLQEVKPFTAQALPALNKAASVAPALTNLAEQATPTITKAVPTLAALQNVAHLASPLSTWLGLSAPALVNILGDWAGAVQNRDAASHIFSGNVFINPDVVLTTANLGATGDQKRANLLDIKSLPILQTLGLVGAQRAARAAANASAPSKAPAVHSTVPKLNLPKVNLPAVHLPAVGSSGSSPTTAPKPSLGSTLGSTLGGVLSGVGKLLGGHSGAASSGSGTSGSSAGATGATGQSGVALGGALKGLVGYLLGK